MANKVNLAQSTVHVTCQSSSMPDGILKTCTFKCASISITELFFYNFPLALNAEHVNVNFFFFPTFFCQGYIPSGMFYEI